MTSAGSAELVAVSTLVTYDVYRTYINPKASGDQILKVSRYVVFGFGMFMGVLAVLLNVAGVSLGWMYLAMGVFIGSAVMPVAFLLLWSKASSAGAITGAICGCLLGVTTWLVTTQVEYGRVTLSTTGRNAPMLAGNVVSILSGGAICALVSMLNPQNFTWDATRNITVVEHEESEVPEEEYTESNLKHARNWIIKWGVAFTVLILILWPLLALPAKVFSEGYFTLWASIAIIWGSIGSIVIIILPLYESWDTIAFIAKCMFTDDIIYSRFNELDMKLKAILKANPEAERDYLREKEALNPKTDKKSSSTFHAPKESLEKVDDL